MKTSPLLLIGLGAIALYVAYTGRLQGAWDGITGKFDRPPTTGDQTSGSKPPDEQGGYIGPPGSGGIGQMTPSGIYAVTTSGGMMLTDAGIY